MSMDTAFNLFAVFGICLGLWGIYLAITSHHHH
jgi:hypothetical protein